MANGIYHKKPGIAAEQGKHLAEQITRQQLIAKLVSTSECGEYAANGINAFLEKKYFSEEDRVAKLKQILEFAQTAKPKAAIDYFDAVGLAIQITTGYGGATKEMQEKVEAREFSALEALTDERVLKTRMTDFIYSAEKEYPIKPKKGDRGRSIGGGAYDYYKAVAFTGEVEALTSEKMISFAKAIGPHLAKTYFMAIESTSFRPEERAKAKALLDERIFGAEVVGFIKALGTEISLAYAYFEEIGRTGAVAELTDRRVLKTAEFIKSAGSAAAHGYFRAIGETKAIAALTNERVFATAKFAKSLGSETQPWKNEAAHRYYCAIGETGAVAELTDKRVFATAKFARWIEQEEDSEVKHGYFYAIGKTKALDVLTSGRVLKFAESIGERGGQRFFEAIGITGAVDALTTDRVFRFAEPLGAYGARDYFQAISETGAVDVLTSERIIGFGEFLGESGAQKYFVAIYKTKAIDLLTSEKVLAFARQIGSGTAERYFNIIGFKNAAVALTDERVLGTAEFAKEIGEKAAGQYFFAIGSTGAVEALTSERIFSFARALGGTIAAEYFIAVGSSGKVAMLGDEKVLRMAAYVKSKTPEFAQNYFKAIAYTEAVEEFTCDAGTKYLDAMGGMAQQFLEGMLVAPPASARFVLGCWSRFQKEKENAMLRVIDRSPELLIYHGYLATVGYDASEETEFLIKKGSKAEITRLALGVRDGVGSLKEYREPFEYVAQLAKMGFRPEERIRAIDRLVISAPLLGILPTELKADITASLSRSLSPDLSVAEEALRKAYPDVMEYVDRHIAYGDAHPEYKSPIRKEDAVQLIAACHSLGRKSLNLGTVNVEKQQMGTGRQIAFKPKFEAKFLEELAAAANRARYDAVIDAMDAHRTILEHICGEKVEKGKEISPELRNVLEGYFRLAHNNELLTDLIKAYYLTGAEAAKEWVSGLEGNGRAVERMRKRGTDLDAINRFRVEYKAVGVRSIQEKQAIRASQVYSELLSLLQELGYKSAKELGVGETGDREMTAITMSKRLNELVREGKFSPEQKRVIDDINGHVENLKSAVGQLHAVEAEANVVFFVPTDPVKKLQMGVGFPSCLDIRNGCNNFGAVARTIDANNVTLYAAEGNETGKVIGRVSLMESGAGFFVNSHFYENTNRDLFAPGSGWVDALIKFSEATGRDVMVVPNMYAPHAKIEETLGKAGFVLEKGVKAHVDKAVCGSIYSDLGFGGEILDEGKDATFDAYVLRAKK